MTEMEIEYPDFTSPDEMSSVTLVIEDHKLFVHREVLAAWSPVFKTMFTRDFKGTTLKNLYGRYTVPPYLYFTYRIDTF